MWKFFETIRKNHSLLKVLIVQLQLANALCNSESTKYVQDMSSLWSRCFCFNRHTINIRLRFWSFASDGMSHDHATHIPSLIHLAVKLVLSRRLAIPNPFPSVLLYKICEIPNLRRKLVKGVYPYVCVRLYRRMRSVNGVQGGYRRRFRGRDFGG